MKTKHILTAMVLPAMFAACTAEEIVENNNVAANANFAQVESVGFTTTGLESRLLFNPKTLAWDWEDTDSFILYMADDASTLNESTASKTVYPGQRFKVGTTLTTAYEYAKGENGGYVTEAPVMREGLYWGYAPSLKEVGRGLVKYEVATSQDADYYQTEEAQAFITPIYEVSSVNYNNELPLEMINWYTTVVFSLNNDTDEDITLNQIVLEAEGGKKFLTKGLIDVNKMKNFIVAYDGEEWAPMQNLDKGTTNDIKATKTMTEMEVYMDNFRQEYLASKDDKDGKESKIILLNLDGEVLEAGKTKEFYMMVPAVENTISCTIAILAEEGYVEIKSSDDSNYMHDTKINHNGKKSAFGWKTVKGEQVAKSYSIDKLNKNSSKRYYVAEYDDMMDLIEDVNGNFEAVNVGDWNIDAKMADAITASDSYVTFSGDVNVGANVEGRAASGEEITLTKIIFEDNVVVKEGNVVTFSKQTNTKPVVVDGTLEIEEAAKVTLAYGKYEDAKIVVEDGAVLTIENGASANGTEVDNIGETTLIEQPGVAVNMKGGKLNLDKHKDTKTVYDKYLGSNINFLTGYTCEVVVAKGTLLTIDEDMAVSRGYVTEDHYYEETLTVNGDLAIEEELTVSGYVKLNGDSEDGEITIKRNGTVWNEGTCDSEITIDEGGTFYNNYRAKNVASNDGLILAGKGSRTTIEAGEGRVDNSEGAVVTANQNQTVFYLFSGDVDDLEEIPFEQFKVNTLRVEEELILDRPFTTDDADITKQLGSLKVLELGNGATIEVDGREGKIINTFEAINVEGNLDIEGWKKAESVLSFYNPVTVTLNVKSKANASDETEYEVNISELSIEGRISWKRVLEPNQGYGWNATKVYFEDATAGTFGDYKGEVESFVDGKPVTAQGTIVFDKAALEAAIAKGGVVTLGGDIKTELVFEKVGNNAVLNLNGYNIVAEGTAITVKDGTLTIDANQYSEVKSTGEGIFAAVSANGADAKVVIKGGKYSAGLREANTDGKQDGNAAVETRGGGEIEILDGYFYVADKRYTNGRNNVYFVLNNDDTSNPGSKIVVKGGEFENFNPARPMTDLSEDISYLDTNCGVQIWKNGTLLHNENDELWTKVGKVWNKYAWEYAGTSAASNGDKLVYKVVEL